MVNVVGYGVDVVPLQRHVEMQRLLHAQRQAHIANEFRFLSIFQNPSWHILTVLEYQVVVLVNLLIGPNPPLITL